MKINILSLLIVNSISLLRIAIGQDYSLRLFGERNACGLLQMFHGNSWFDFCFEDNQGGVFAFESEAPVACRDLGFRKGGRICSTPIFANISESLNLTKQLNKTSNCIGSAGFVDDDLKLQRPSIQTRYNQPVYCIGGEARLSQCFVRNVENKSSPCLNSNNVFLCCDPTLEKQEIEKVNLTNEEYDKCGAVDIGEFCLSSFVIVSSTVLLLAVVAIVIFLLILLKSKRFSKQRKLLSFRNFGVLIFIAKIALIIIGSSQIWALFAKYIHNPLETDYQMELRDELSLPKVMVCLYHRFNNSKINALPVNTNDFTASAIEMQFLFGALKTFYSAHYYHYFVRTNKMNLIMGAIPMLSYLLDSNVTTSVIKQISYTCKDFAKECYFNNIKLDCCEKAEHRITSLGNCAVLDSKIQRSINDWFQIRLELPANRLDTKTYAAPHNFGAELRFINPTTNMVNPGYTLASVGSQTYIKLKHEKVSLINREDLGLSCNDDNSYDQSVCEMVCADYPTKYCNCTTVSALADWLTVDKSMKVCNAIQFDDCYEESLRATYTSNGAFVDWNITGNDLISSCRQKCIKPCQYENYKKQTSHFRLRKNEKNSKKPDSDWLQRSVVVNLQYESLMSTVISQYRSYDEMDLLSDMGGIMGSWIGASFLTIIYMLQQTITYIVKLLAIIIRNCKKKFESKF